MSITGIICEYNPLHLGHKKQLDTVKAAIPDGGIVCLMSGNYVQRGTPAVFDKTIRAKAAILAGADLVLELPVTAALSSAEGFAAEGVRILSGFCDYLSFGAENADISHLMDLAKALLSKEFPDTLRAQLKKGLSFPAARQFALESMGIDANVLTLPNNILAVEYCKAILAQNAAIQPMVIDRQGSYHDTMPDPENPSATALRQLLEQGADWKQYVPDTVCFENATIHKLQNAETAILARLWTMTDEEFEALPYGSEGLWRKLMHAARSSASVDDIIDKTKSKRYTHTRIDRMILCAFLGITKQIIDSPAPYVRILAFNDKGREILKKARTAGHFVNLGEQLDDPVQNLEDRCDQLYGLFVSHPEAKKDYRIYYHK